MNKEWLTAAELAGLNGMPKHPRVVNLWGEDKKMERRARLKGKGWEYRFDSLPAETQAALLRLHSQEEAVPVTSFKDYEEERQPFTYDRAALWSNFESKPEGMKAKARNRLAAIRTALQLIINKIPRTKAFATAASTAGFNRASLYRWYQEVKKYDEADWLAALLPKYVGRTVKAECSDAAWDFFKADYLRLEQPGYAACYERLKRAAADREWTIPSIKTLQRRMEKDVPITVRVLKREGEYALMRLYPSQQRSVAELHALQWINADGYQHNVFVKWPDGTIARPKTWFFQDIYSRLFLSWRTDQTEHTDVIRLSFGDLVERFGIPEHVTIDNTRAAANKWMTGGVPNRYRFKVKEDDPMGLFPTLGVQVHWTTVLNGKGHGQAKPIERAFGVGGFGEYIDKHPEFAGAFTGNNPMAKPENYGSKAIPLETFLRVLNQEVIAWNEREGRRTEMAEGRSFLQVFEESYAKATIRKATVEQRRLWLLTAEAVRVKDDASVILDAGSASGIGKNRYHAEALFEFTGKKVVIRFDPDQLHSAVHFYTIDGRYIAEGYCIDATGFGDTLAARQHSRARKQFIKSTKEAAKAEEKMDAIEVAAFLPESDIPTLPEPGAIRMLQPQHHRREAPVARALTDEERAIQQEMFNNPAPVQRLPETARQKYMRWVQLDERVRTGISINDEERHWHKTYQTTAEFMAEHEVAIEFGLVAGQ